MKSMIRKSWPKDVDEVLSYRLGERPLHEYLIRNAKERPEKTAYMYSGNEITWEQLYTDTARVAQFLSNQGVEKGDRIGLFMQNCPQYVIGHYAIQMLGATVVPLNPMYKESELEYLIAEADVLGVIAGQELAGRIKAVRRRAPSLSFIITANYADFLTQRPALPLAAELKIEKEQVKDTFDFLEILYTNQPIKEFAEVDLWNDIALLVFTSGTTGRPKAAMLTYGNALFKTAATAQSSYIAEGDRMLASAPFCHIAGMVMGVNLPIYSGCMCTALTRFEPEAAITAIETFLINKMYTAAPMNAAILNHPNIEERDLSSLELNFATSFGIPVNEQLAEEWKRLTRGCLLYEAAYGLSETHTCDTFMPISQIKYGSVGIPTFETEIAIVDMETKKELPLGEPGEITVRGPGVFKGYWNRPEATEETLRNGWIHTGDIGKLDEDGYLYFLGRAKEMIKSSGYSLFPEDVEALMMEHEAIHQVAAVGVPHETRGETVKAYVVLKPDFKGKVGAAELIDWAKGKMAAYKYPREIELREHLPATTSGKVLRRLLKEE